MQLAFERTRSLNVTWAAFRTSEYNAPPLRGGSSIPGASDRCGLARWLPEDTEAGSNYLLLTGRHTGPGFPPDETMGFRRDFVIGCFAPTSALHFRLPLKTP